MIFEIAEKSIWSQICQRPKIGSHELHQSNGNNMRYILALLFAAGVAVLLTFAALAETIPAVEASHHIGSEMTVEGVVSQVSTSSGGTTFINFGGRYPNHVFYAVIFRDIASQFSGVHKLEGRAVAISGTVELYKGKPQIILSSPDQIEMR